MMDRADLDNQFGIEKVSESAYFFVDVRNYVLTVPGYDPALGNQMITFEPEPGEEEGEVENASLEPDQGHPSILP